VDFFNNHFENELIFIGKITHSIGGSGFGSGSSGGSGSGGGSSVWVRLFHFFKTFSDKSTVISIKVRAGKKFLPHAVRYGKRYYERRKYNKGMYAGMGAGAGYYAGSQMNRPDRYYSSDDYNYPPVVDDPPEQIDGKPPTVFYCIQEDLNTTLVNKTLNEEGFGVCNISGELVTCPIEIQCRTDEADNCCEGRLLIIIIYLLKRLFR
jgi:hypothetical protein